LEYLEAKGYVASASQNTKRYKSPLMLTEQGCEVAKKIAYKIDGILEVIGTDLTEAERIAFYRSLSIISDRLELLSKNGEPKE
jgi:DNA-binding MarR family transcriptional regulator